MAASFIFRDRHAAGEGGFRHCRRSEAIKTLRA